MLSNLAPAQSSSKSFSERKFKMWNAKYTQPEQSIEGVTGAKIPGL